MKQSFFLLFISALIISSSAVANHHEGKQKATEIQKSCEPEIIHSGFLEDYSDFQVINQKTKAEVWLKPGFDDFSMLKKYKYIILCRQKSGLLPRMPPTKALIRMNSKTLPITFI